MASKKKPDPRAVLKEFVQDIDQTGGVFVNHEGNPAPVADSDWIDLGATYVKACAVLRRKPKIVRNEQDEDHEDLRRHDALGLND